MATVSKASPEVEDPSFFQEYRDLIKIVLCIIFGLILFASIALNIVFYNDNTEFTWRMASMKEKIRASVVVACGIDIRKEPKNVSFTKEENSEGEEYTVLTCKNKK